MIEKVCGGLKQPESDPERLRSLTSSPHVRLAGENAGWYETPGPRFHPGVMGCGIILSHVSSPSLAACQQLGEALETVYARVSHPHHQNGALTFSQPSL